MKRLTLLPFFLLLASAAQASPLVLARDGKALLPIVISAQSSARTREAAAELAAYLKQMTGAEFTVTSGENSGGIFVGTLPEFPVAALRRPLALKGRYDGLEAYAIRTERARLLLIGGSDVGANHAVFRFLEEMGCRWFFPSRAWEVIPHRPELTVDIDLVDRPKILARRIWYGYGPFEGDGHPEGSSPQRDYEAWARHNRMARSFQVNAGHAWQNIILENAQVFKAHPEYLALVKGKRQGEQLCVSNPAVRALAVQYALDWLKKHPEEAMVSMEVSDGDGQCECPECKKLGSISDRVFGLGNTVAGAVAKEMPGRMVGMYAYNEHSEPPSFALEPNLYVQLTAGFTRGQYTFDELLDLWPKRCRNFGIYEYLSVWLWDFDRPGLGRGADIPYLQKQIRRYAKLGITSMDGESGNNWGPHGLGYYLANRLMWNPDVDVDALQKDFFAKAFGPAAPAMARFYGRLAPGDGVAVSRERVGLAVRDLQAALQQTSGNAAIQNRLNDLRAYLRYIHLRWLVDHEPDKTRRAHWTVEALRTVYRTRFSYMNHWNAMRQTWADQASKEFNEPTWTLQSAAPKPWLDPTPVTEAERDLWMQEALDYFQPFSPQERAFSGPLTVANLPGNLAPLHHQYQNPAAYALASEHGEPLALSITTGVIAWYRDRAALVYTLKDPRGRLVTTGKLPLDGQPHPLLLTVPRAGVYILDVQDHGSGWAIQAEATQKAALLLAQDQTYYHLGHMPEVFFYVPAGTRELEYFWQGGPHRVFGPDGKEIAHVTSSDEIVRIPVPRGADGKPWSFREFAPGRLWFYNAPNMLAASPASLILPRDATLQSKPL